MKFDVYNCDECGVGFTVEINYEPAVCPVCESEIWEYSHTIKGEMVEEECS